MSTFFATDIYQECKWLPCGLILLQARKASTIQSREQSLPIRTFGPSSIICSSDSWAGLIVYSVPVIFMAVKQSAVGLQAVARFVDRSGECICSVAGNPSGKNSKGYTTCRPPHQPENDRSHSPQIIRLQEAHILVTIRSHVFPFPLSQRWIFQEFFLIYSSSLPFPLKVHHYHYTFPFIITAAANRTLGLPFRIKNWLLWFFSKELPQ